MCHVLFQVRGMCHRSEAADQAINDLTGVYEVGDLVKAVVLKVSPGPVDRSIERCDE